MASDSDFVRLDDRVRQVEPIARQMARVEDKVDDLHKALTSLVLFEERQATQAERVRELELRAAAMAQRFDTRVSDLDRQLQTLSAELHGYVQRYMGISAAIGAGAVCLGAAWSVASKFIP